MGKRKVEGQRGRGPSSPRIHSPPLLWSLVTGFSPHLRHHHCHTVACHTDSTVQTRLLQIPRRLPVVFGFCFVFFCLFVCLFFTTAITTSHITVALYSVTFRHRSSVLSYFVGFDLKKNTYAFYWWNRLKKKLNNKPVCEKKKNGKKNHPDVEELGSSLAFCT